MPNRLSGARSEFDSLMARIAVSVPKTYRKEAYYHLGKAFFSAMDSPDNIKPLIFFKNIREFVDAKATERGRFIYVMTSMLLASVFVLILVPIYFRYRLIYSGACLVGIGGLCGAVGASISVLQRNPTLRIDPFVGRGYIAFQGAARIILGFIFGCIFVIASKANFILGIVGDNLYPILILSVVAGLSERFIPELLSRFEANQLKEE